MRSINVILIIASFIFPYLTANAGIIVCPGPQEMQPFLRHLVTDIKPIPYPQCFYTAKAIDVSKDECDELNKQMVSHLQKIGITNWSCHFFPDSEDYNYSFTFMATDK